MVIIAKIGSNKEIHFRVAEQKGDGFARVVVRMSQIPIFYVQWCQDDTPLTNFPPATKNINRYWKFIKHGVEGLSIECDGVEVANLKFAEAPKSECSSSKWVTSKVNYLYIDGTYDETYRFRGETTEKKHGNSFSTFYSYPTQLDLILGGGFATQKNRRKPVPNLKFAVAFFFRFFGFFFGFFVVLFRFFFGLNFDKNCLITHLMPKKPCKCSIKAIITNKNHLTRTR